MAKFDDVSYHSGAADFPKDAPEENGATHIGMFVTWSIRKGLFVDAEVPAEAIDAVRQGTLSGRDFLLEHCDGKLVSGSFNQEGAVFATKHYDGYLDDFERLLCAGLKSDYLVEDSAANYEIMASALDQRWTAFQQSRTGR
jgi:hypothetical protein